MNTKTARRVWDLPTRLFHWSLVSCFAGLWYTGEQGDMTNHFRLGYAVLGLLVFRLGWGLWGSQFSRFSALQLSPRTALAYLRQGMKDDKPGHNPLGSWGVVFLLAGLWVQVSTGLFATDDIFSEGPLCQFVSSSLSSWLTGLHHDNFDILLWIVGVHISAVLFHTLWHKEDLIPGMITGRRNLPSQPSQPAPAEDIKTPWIPALLLASFATLVALGVSSLG